MTVLAVLILVSTFLTSILSAIFGMAGGMILMGLLAHLLPVVVALALHGVVQLASNGWRVALLRRHVVWPILGYFGAGAVVATVLFALIAFVPSKLLIFAGLGLMPILIWLPEHMVKLDATRPPHAVAAGFLSTILSLAAGVSGPVTDLFFIHSPLTRHQVVATKAVMQGIGHFSKIVVYGAVLMNPAVRETIPYWLLAAILAISMVGVMVGGALLNRMSDRQFFRWRRWLVTLISLSFLVQAVQIALS